MGILRGTVRRTWIDRFVWLKYGPLEKHKDYVRRARDFHVKKHIIYRMQIKMAKRNLNEYYRDMDNACRNEKIYDDRSLGRFSKALSP